MRLTETCRQTAAVRGGDNDDDAREWRWKTLEWGYPHVVAGLLPARGWDKLVKNGGNTKAEQVNKTMAEHVHSSFAQAAYDEWTRWRKCENP